MLCFSPAYLRYDALSYVSNSRPGNCTSHCSQFCAGGQSLVRTRFTNVAAMGLKMTG